MLLIIERAGVHKIKPHDLRHTFVSMVIAEGSMSIVELSRYIGHADPAFTLRRYAHIFERHDSQEPPSLKRLLGSR